MGSHVEEVSEAETETAVRNGPETALQTICLMKQFPNLFRAFDAKTANQT